MSSVEPNDPTASATPYPTKPAPLTLLSRNEVETLCLKAARGAGMPWGLAEEAGFAVGWLAHEGLDGAAALLAHLQTVEAGAGVDTCPRIIGRDWCAAENRPICPIALGAALDDRAALESGPATAPITTGTVSRPLLVLPFLARAASACGRSLSLQWDGGVISVSSSGTLASGAARALSDVAAAALRIGPAEAEDDCAAPEAQPLPALTAATLSGLNAYALRTTVPASDASRLGAGAAASDND